LEAIPSPHTSRRRQSLKLLIRLTRVFSLLIPILCGLALSSSAFAQSNQSVYSDALDNGWQNWSWASVNLSNSAPVHSGSASISVNAGAYQALYLHHDAFDSSLYTSLVFWINGGPTGGQLLQVQAELSGTAQTVVTLPALAANTWQQFTIPLASLGVQSKPNLDGFWIQDRSGTTLPTFYVDDMSLLAPPPPSVVNLNVDAAQVLRTIDARHSGRNAAVWDSVFDTTTTINLLTEMGNQALRFPGGSLSDDYHWATNTTDNNAWQWATSFAKFATVATTTGAQVFITVNYGSGTAAEAASWVSNSNVTNHYGFKYWEVGNENYGSWETDTNTRPHDPYTYAQHFKDYYTQMKAVDPTIKIGAVAVTGEDSFANYTDHPAVNPRTGQTHYGWTPVMLATLKSLGVTPDFLIYHRYPQAPGAESDEGLLLSSGTWATDAADLRQQLNDYLGTSTAAGVELDCTENNSVFSNPGKQTTSLVNGLFLADSVCAAMHTEFNSVMWWDMRNGQDTTNNNSSNLYGWRLYGDYGVVDSADPAGPADRYPTFYVAKLIQYFARGGDHLISSTSDYPLLSICAAKQASGSLALLVINKSASAALNANITISNVSPATSGTVYSYGAPQDDAAQTGIGSADIASSTVSGLSTNFSYDFPAYSATVIAFGSGAPPPPVRQPDNLIKASGDASYLGEGIFNTDGTSQTRPLSIRAGRSATFIVNTQNDGSATDTFTILGSGSSSPFSVKYYSGASGGTDITSAVTAGTYKLSNVAAGSSQYIHFVVTAASAPSGTNRGFLVTAISAADTTKRDAVKASVSVK
jgi:alpha-L-arabinofuranosidase